MPPEEVAQSLPPEESPTTEETSSQTPPEGENEGDVRFEDVDFSELTEFVDSGDVDGIAEIEAAAPSDEATVSEQEEAPPEETPPADDKESPPEPEAKESEAEEEKSEATVEPEEAKPEPVKVPTREELEGMFEEFRKDSLPSLEKLYEMDEETAAAFDENPKEVLAKIAGRLHFDVMMSTYNAVLAAMPSSVGQVLNAANAAQSAETQFFERWPQLKEAKPDVVRSAIQAYRSANPTASMEDAIEKAGMLAMIQAGISLDPPKAAEPPPPKRKPARPAAPGGIPAAPPPRPSTDEANPFSDLAQDWDKNQFS